MRSVPYNKSMNGLCDNCGLKQCPNPCDRGCGPCKKSCCEGPKPVIDVQALPDDILTLSFNFNGVGTTYDYREMIKAGQTDTTLTADAIKRVLKYMAERHTDTISARELGAILHLSDIGDVEVDDINAYSMLFYKKDATDACDTTANRWVGWNALDEQTGSLESVMGFLSTGAPKSLSSPSLPSQYYQLGWNANGKIGWKQPRKVTSTANLAPVYIDKTTHELVYVEES